MKNRIIKLIEDVQNLSDKTSFKQKVTILAVTKTQSVSKIIEAYDYGLRRFGENKVQEALLKMDQLKEYNDIQWHLIGHLQSNKVKKIKDFSLVQSIDSIKLLMEIARFNNEERPDVLIQINSSQESTKSGLNLDEVDDFFKEILENGLIKDIKIRGLMTIGPLTDDKNQIRKSFKKTRKIYEDLQIKYNLNFDTLSMGMSNDYDIAIEEGSNMIRIGSLIFGERNYD